MGNPWKGVVPYSETDDIKSFHGRDKEIKELIQTIKQNYIATLYGRSGIGKTSLLKVGLSTEELRQEGYCPVIIRLSDNFDEEGDYIEQIVKSIERELSVKPLHGIDEIPVCAKEAQSFLWNYFAYHEFYSKDESAEEVVPVVILDQFEEVLRNCENDVSPALLIQQIHDTLQDGYLTDGSPYTIGFRFVLSLREDDLYLLEDLLDKQHIDSLKRGRYRLCRLETKAAKEIIFLKPFLFNEQEKDGIAEEIINKSTQDGQISTLLLSLICFMLYESNKGKSGLTLEEVKLFLKDKPLDKFYRDAVKGISDRSMVWIEMHFKKEDDRRAEVKWNAIPKYCQKEIKEKRLNDESYDHHIFTSSSRSKDSIELLHDKLAVVMSDYEKTRKEEAQKKMWKKIRKLAIALVVVSLVFFVAKHQDAKPERFSDLKIKQNDTIPNGKPYSISDSVLALSHCTVLPYTFCNKDVCYLEIDNVNFAEGNALTLPNLKTLTIGGYDYDGGFFDDSIQSVKTIIARRPQNGLKWGKHVLHNLDTVIITAEDSSFLCWSDGVLYARSDTSKNTWYAKVSVFDYAYYENGFLNDAMINGAYSYYTYDIANPCELPKNCYNVKLICTDSTHRVLKREDIPHGLRDKIVIIEMPYVDTIKDYLFKDSLNPNYCNYSLKRVICPNAVSVAPNAFENCKATSSFILKDGTQIPTKTTETKELGNAYGKKGFHYNNRGTIIYIDSVEVPSLVIGPNVQFIKCSNGIDDPIVDNVEIDKENRTFYKWHGDVYKRFRSSGPLSNGLIIETNKEKYVVLSHAIYLDSLVTNKKRINGNNYKKLIALNPTSIDRFKDKRVELYVPNGQREYYSQFKNDFSEIHEMTYLATLYYRLFYRHPPKNPFFIESSDYYAWVSCGLFAIILFFIIRWPKIKNINKKWRYIIIDALVLSIVCLIVGWFVWRSYAIERIYTSSGVFYSCEELFIYLRDNNLLGTRDMIIQKESISMWPIWYFVPETWIIYLLLTNNKRCKTKR